MQGGVPFGWPKYNRTARILTGLASTPDLKRAQWSGTTQSRLGHVWCGATCAQRFLHLDSRYRRSLASSSTEAGRSSLKFFASIKNPFLSRPRRSSNPQRLAKRMGRVELLVLGRAAGLPSPSHHLRAQPCCTLPIFVWLYTLHLLIAPALAAAIPYRTDKNCTSFEHGTTARDLGSTAIWTDSELGWHLGVLLTILLWTLFAWWMKSYDHGNYEYWWAIASLSLTLSYGFLAFGEGSRWGASR